jgi:hypothetical protein
MPYIEKTDLNRVFVSESRIDLITADDNGDPQDYIWEEAVNAAIAYMRGGLAGRFDVANIFNQTGAARNTGDGAIVLANTLTVAMWHIYKKVSPDKVPEAIMQEFESIRLWLKGINEFKINPDLPVKTLPQQDQILYGGDTKRNNPSL